MKNLNICVDIDGTITDPYFWLERAANHFWVTVRYDEFVQYEFHKALKISEEDYSNFYEEYKLEYHAKDMLRNSVKEVLNELYDHNNIFFVSARDKSLEMLTLSYLKDNNLPFDGLTLLGSHYKVNEAQKLNCDIFIEDNLNNAFDLSEAGFKVILMNTTYNQGDLNENIIRVYTWMDILFEVNNLIYSNKAV